MIDGIPLIDAHIHVARLDTLKPSWDQWVMAGAAFKPERLYDDHGIVVPERFDEFLASEGVDIGLVLAEYSPRVTGLQTVEDILPLVKHNPERVRLIANVNPHFHHPVKDELERQLQLGAVALKVHPVHGAFPANARELYPAYGVCEDEGVPVVVHCGTSNFPGAANRFADPIFIDDVAKDFPKLKIVLAHGGRGWWYDAAAFLALMRDNVWIELSGLPPKRLRHYYRNQDFERLAEKFIFGTDWPGCPSIRSNALAVAELGLSEALLEKIYYRNALLVYGLRAVWENGAPDASSSG
jgi:predicted TIM-barrel fold metal-dependent hydrolase